LRQPFDLIHAHLHEGALIGWVLSKIKRVPLLFDFQGSMTSEMVDHHFLSADGPWYRPLRRLEKWIDHRPKFIVTSSHHAGDLLQREFGCRPEQVHPLPDAVNLDFFRPDVLGSVAKAEWKTGLSIPAQRPVLVYLGVLAEYQGTRKLLEAAALLRDRGVDVHFLIMGYPAAAYYRNLAQTMGLAGRVTFLGRVPYEQAPRHLALGDIAAAPKMSATEGSGKILNYMAMELPTVAFDTPVSREYLGELGAYARFGDSASLAGAIQGLLADPERARGLGQQSRRWVAEHFSWDQAGEQLLSIYDQLTGAARSIRPAQRRPIANEAGEAPGRVATAQDKATRVGGQ
jgi:glycosyltransferase involved in cell wall biosynthesis